MLMGLLIIGSILFLVYLYFDSVPQPTLEDFIKDAIGCIIAIVVATIIVGILRTALV